MEYIYAKEHLFCVYIASSKHKEGWRVGDNYANPRRMRNFWESSQLPRVFRWGYVNMEKSALLLLQNNSQKYGGI